MGNRFSSLSSASALVNGYDSSEWQFKSQLKHCSVWYNNKLDISADAYQIPIEYLEKSFHSYDKRRPGSSETRNIVWVYHVVVQQNDFVCNMQKYVRVLTEHIPVRLSCVQNLSET